MLRVFSNVYWPSVYPLWRSVYSGLLFTLFYFIYLFLYRGERIGRKRGRETSVCGCLSCAPYWWPGLQPRHVPWLGIKLVTLCFAGQHSIYWATPARATHFLIGLFAFLVLSCIHSWYILHINSLLDVSLVICCPMEWVPFTFCWWLLLLCRSFLVWCSWCSSIHLFFLSFSLP